MHMSLCELPELVMDREAWHAAIDSWGRKESDRTERLHFRYADDTTLLAESEEELKAS